MHAICFASAIINFQKNFNVLESLQRNNQKGNQKGNLKVKCFLISIPNDRKHFSKYKSYVCVL